MTDAETNTKPGWSIEPDSSRSNDIGSGWGISTVVDLRAYRQGEKKVAFESQRKKHSIADTTNIDRGTSTDTSSAPLPRRSYSRLKVDDGSLPRVTEMVSEDDSQTAWQTPKGNARSGPTMVVSQTS